MCRHTIVCLGVSGLDKESDMSFLLDLLRGALIGVANIIPGVSGGTMMVTMGIYDKLLSSITGLFKHFKKSVMTLLPYFLGMGVGIVGFAFLLTKYLLVKFPLPTAFAFIGLIVGGIPLIVKKLRVAGEAEKQAGRKENVWLNRIIFVFFFALILGMQFLGEGVTREVKPSVAIALIMVVMGVITSSAMVIPGVSGSLILLAIGYYNSITAAITDFISALKAMDFPVLFEKFAVLFPFGIGVLLGIFFVAKLIEWLLRKHGKTTYYGILGLVVSSPVPVFLNALNTDVPVTVGAVVASALTCAAGTVAAYVMSKE